MAMPIQALGTEQTLNDKYLSNGWSQASTVLSRGLSCPPGLGRFCPGTPRHAAKATMALGADACSLLRVLPALLGTEATRHLLHLGSWAFGPVEAINAL